MFLISGEAGGLLVFSQRPLPDHLRHVTGVFEGDQTPQNGAELGVVRDMNQPFFPLMFHSLTEAQKKEKS